jgi:hypothetical protein
LSEDTPRSRPRRHFGFNGPRRRVGAREKDVGVDEILDSLSRRSQLSDGLDRVEIAPPVEELEAQFVIGAEVKTAKIARQHSLGKYAFPLLLLAGLVIVGLYGALRSVTNPAGILRVIQNPGFEAVFTDPVRLGLVMLFCAVPAFIVRRHRRAHDRLTYV